MSQDRREEPCSANREAEACALLREVPLDDFMAADPDAEKLAFAISQILPRRVVTLLGGHGGAAKSTVTLIVLAHAACGHDWAGFSPGRPLQCVLVSLEDSPEIVLDRLRRIVEVYELDADLIAANLRLVDGTETDGALALEVNDYGVRDLQFTVLFEQLKDFAFGADVLAIDNASDAFAADENSRRLVRKFLRKLAAIVKPSNGAVLLLVHIDKQAARFGANGQSYVGSVAWHNSSRSRLALVAGKDDTIELRHEKVNFGRMAEPVTLRWRDGLPVPMRGAEGDARRASDEDDAVRLVRAAAASGVPMLAATLGAHTGWHATRHLPEAAAFKDKPDGPRRLFVALEAASRHGRIRRVEELDHHRNKREVWKLPETAEALNAVRASATASESAKAASNGARSFAPHTPPLNARTRAGGGRVHSSKDLKRH